MAENNTQNVNTEDYIIRGTAAKDKIRFFAATTRNMVEKARQIHDLSPVASAALGRTLTATAMMSTMMKGEDNSITVLVDGDGPIGKITVAADSHANVRGFVRNPQVMLPISKEGKLDVGGAVGTNGMLTVIKDLGLNTPYNGQVKLISGEIAEDFTCYFAISEQVPSAVALGVLMNPENTVRTAGGFIIQLMPDAEEELISYLEQKMTEVTEVSGLLDEGMTPEEIMQYILEPYDPRILEKVPCAYSCPCSRERFARGIASLANKDLKSLIDDNRPAEAGCVFCGKKYVFELDELKAMLEARRRAAAEKVLNNMDVIQ